MNIVSKLLAAIVLAAAISFGPAEAQESPETSRELREQVEILIDRINESRLGERIDELHERIETLERELQERIGHSEEREHMRELEGHIEMLERELEERAGHSPEAGHIRELQEHIRRLEGELGERRGTRPGEFRAPDWLPGTVTLEFNGGGVAVSVSTAMLRYKVQGHSLNQSHQHGEITKREEFTLVAAGMVEIDSRTGSIFVACEGTFTFNYVSLDDDETGESKESSIKFNASVRLQPGEVRALVSQGGRTLTVKATLQRLPPPGEAPPSRRR